MLPVLSFIFLLHQALGDERVCPFNEEVSNCLGHCQNYCNWNSGTIIKPPCPKICKSGCVCREGYVRQLPEGRGFCILETKCKKCPAHEHFDECGARCQNSCLNPDGGKPDICVFNQIFALICAAGCVCDEEFAREDGTPQSPCVAIKDCP